MVVAHGTVITAAGSRGSEWPAQLPTIEWPMRPGWIPVTAGGGCKLSMTVDWTADKNLTRAESHKPSGACPQRMGHAPATRAFVR